ncbi:malto-oligosyltrehalose trehalohydrolase [Devosia beringensis]|uniref:malto-oligosyltrehalose trehalohydrolase n=1 Tax=Devosia beringensis TaxID=2657486 RepID=UPI00186B6C0C|nr:malto-oligosyltrehalose trehalohydrolase [Devosia beringensis]
MTHHWGAVPHDDGTWSVATWAPSAKAVTVELKGGKQAMVPDGDGWWYARVGASPGTSYQFISDGQTMPDPASRLQAGGVHAQSVLVDHRTYPWRSSWQGRPWPEAVIYELHVGTFTPEGTFAAAMDRLDELADLGITAIEVMPVGQWSGKRGWGYDGVLPYAPHPAYGTPDAFKAFVDHAHGLGMMVILDIVMNHFGSEGAHLHSLAPEFFAPERHTPWGAAIHFDLPAVREFWIACASMWIADYRLDGLRFDAVHEITGPGADDFLAEMATRLRALDPARRIHLITEDDRNSPRWREDGLYDASWNDDFHHAIHTALTGEDHDYYASYAVDPIGDLCRALAHGQVEEGQERQGRDGPRGEKSDHLQPTAFVNAIQTHDQIGNRPHGERLITLADAKAVEVAYAMLLVAPYVPMIVMGEERGEQAPFLFFADFHGELADNVREGRAAEIGAIAAAEEPPPDPLAVDTFAASKLTWKTDAAAQSWLALTRQALAFRRDYVVPLLKSGRVGAAQARRIGGSAIEANWRFAAGSLHLAVNFGTVGAFPPGAQEPQFTLNRIERDNFALSVQGHFHD